MYVRFDPRRRIYDLYSFDAPYDLEPRGFSDSSCDYSEGCDSHESSTLADMEDQGDEFKGLDLTFEEAELGRRFPITGLRPSPKRDSAGGEHPIRSPVLGATLSQRKKLLKERIEELITDIHKRKRLRRKHWKRWM